jgi:hypothetical protein
MYPFYLWFARFAGMGLLFIRIQRYACFTSGASAELPVVTGTEQRVLF